MGSITNFVKKIGVNFHKMTYDYDKKRALGYNFATNFVRNHLARPPAPGRSPIGHAEARGTEVFMRRKAEILRRFAAQNDRAGFAKSAQRL